MHVCIRALTVPVGRNADEYASLFDDRQSWRDNDDDDDDDGADDDDDGDDDGEIMVIMVMMMVPMMMMMMMMMMTTMTKKKSVDITSIPTCTDDTYLGVSWVPESLRPDAQVYHAPLDHCRRRG